MNEFTQIWTDNVTTVECWICSSDFVKVYHMTGPCPFQSRSLITCPCCGTQIHLKPELQ